jgi:transposase
MSLRASSLTFACASFGQQLLDWIEAQTKALAYFGGVPKAVVCDNLKAGVATALSFQHGAGHIRKMGLFPPVGSN